VVGGFSLANCVFTIIRKGHGVPFCSWGAAKLDPHDN
jgi:hypothetical protein